MKNCSRRHRRWACCQKFLKPCDERTHTVNDPARNTGYQHFKPSTSQMNLSICYSNRALRACSEPATMAIRFLQFNSLVDTSSQADKNFLLPLTCRFEGEGSTTSGGFKNRKHLQKRSGRPYTKPFSVRKCTTPAVHRRIYGNRLSSSQFFPLGFFTFAPVQTWIFFTTRLAQELLPNHHTRSRCQIHTRWLWMIIASHEEGGFDWFTEAHRHQGGGVVSRFRAGPQAFGYVTVLGLASWHSHSYPSWILYHRHPHSYYSTSRTYSSTLKTIVSYQCEADEQPAQGGCKQTFSWCLTYVIS